MSETSKKISGIASPSFLVGGEAELNLAANSISVLVDEKAGLKVMLWVDEVKRRVEAGRSSPFVDEPEPITIKIRDYTGEDVAELAFKGLRLAGHRCVFTTEGAPGNLRHKIDLTYTSCQIHVQPTI